MARTTRHITPQMLKAALPRRHALTLADHLRLADADEAQFMEHVNRLQARAERTEQALDRMFADLEVGR